MHIPLFPWRMHTHFFSPRKFIRVVGISNSQILQLPLVVGQCMPFELMEIPRHSILYYIISPVIIHSFNPVSTHTTRTYLEHTDPSVDGREAALRVMKEKLEMCQKSLNDYLEVT